MRMRALAAILALALLLPSVASAAMPTFVACGAFTLNVAGANPALPAGIQTNDILLMPVETSDQAVTITDSAGGTWAETADSPQSPGSLTRLTVFWSRYNGTQTAPTTSDSGDHQGTFICAFRGVTTSGDPWDVTSGGSEVTADTSYSIPGDTTTVANTMVVIIYTSAADTTNADAAARFGSQSNSDLANLTERKDSAGTGANGGQLGLTTGEKATAGSYGATTLTSVDADAKAYMTIALKEAVSASAPLGGMMLRGIGR